MFRAILRIVTVTLLVCGCRGAERQQSNSQSHPAFHLVQEYAERDARGEFAGVSAWYDSMTRFDKEPRGFDQGAVIRGYTVMPTYLGADSALVAVMYDEVGVIEGDGAGGARISFRDSVYADTFAVRRTPEGWRIVRPIVPAHELIDVIAKGSGITPSQRADLLAAKDRKR